MLVLLSGFFRAHLSVADPYPSPLGSAVSGLCIRHQKKSYFFKSNRIRIWKKLIYIFLWRNDGETVMHLRPRIWIRPTIHIFISEVGSGSAYHNCGSHHEHMKRLHGLWMAISVYCVLYSVISLVRPPSLMVAKPTEPILDANSELGAHV